MKVEKEIELKLITDVYSDDETPKLIKKNVIAFISIYPSDIRAWSQVIISSGKVPKNICKIQHKELGALIVAHSYDYISKLKQEPIKDVGFKYNSKDVKVIKNRK